MSLSLDWYSDGLGALSGLVLLSLIFLAIMLNGARNSAPVAKLLPWALLWHLVVFLFNAFWLLPFYGDGSDALGYHNDGIDVARIIRDGAWGDIAWGLNTKAMPIFAGFLYAPFGANIYGALFFSAVLGLGGGFYLCRAFHLWASPAQTRKYSLIVLFMPSVAMWTSTFGKDSWIAFGVGMGAYGYSEIQKSAGAKGTGHFIAGVAITALVRPHIALAIAISMAAAYLWGLTQRTRGSLPMKFLRILVLVAVVGILYPVTRDFVGLSEDASLDSIDESLRKNGAANGELGGSVVKVQVAPGVIGAIRGLPRGMIRVLLEPFPWEVNNINEVLAAAENLFIAWFIVRQTRNVGALIRQVVSVPYLLFSGFLTLALLMMFSFLPNLGLISRQRAQLLPFLFALLVVSKTARKRETRLASITLRPEFAGQLGPYIATSATGSPVNFSKL